MRDVWPPIFASPVASSARYSTYTFPSLTTAAGLNVAYSSQRTMLSFMGERKVEPAFGASAGFASLGFSKGPNIHTRACARSGCVTINKPIAHAHETAEPQMAA